MYLVKLTWITMAEMEFPERNIVHERKNQILRRIKIFLLLLAVFGVISCTGCAERRQTTEQGELVRLYL